MITIADRVQETSTTTGTGTLNLAGAKTGFRGFVAGAGDGAEVYYTIVGQVGETCEGEWEVGIGTVTDATPDTLSRTTILSSSNAGAAVDFSAGTKDVFLTYPAHAGGFKGCIAYKTAAQTLSNTSYTALTWQAEEYDIGDWHDNSTNTSRFTVPAGVSFVRITAYARYAAAATGERRLLFYKNGAVHDPGGRPRFILGANDNLQVVSAISPVFQTVPGDYWEVFGYQNSGGNVDVEYDWFASGGKISWAAIEKVGP